MRPGAVLSPGGAPRVPPPPARKECGSLDVSEKTIVKGSAVLAAGLFLAQIAGFVRQLVIGYLLGTGPAADALTAAMAPLEMAWAIMAVALIFGFGPLFSSRNGQPPHAFGDVLQPVTRLAVAGAIVLLLFASPVVRLFAPGLDAATTATGTWLLRLCSISLIASACTFVYNAYLMSRRRFLVPALQQATVNTATVLGGLLLFRRLGVDSFAYGYVAGSFLHLACTHWYARPILHDPSAVSRRIGVAELLMTPAPIVAQSLAVELNMAVTRAYASTFGSGMTAAFEYALKLFRVPLAMLVVPLSHSFLPEVTRYAEDPVKKTNAWATVVRTSWFLGLASVAATILLMAAREPVVRLLFQRGAFGQTSTETVALLLLGCAPIIIGRSVSDFLSRMLFAIGRRRLPILAAAAALLANIGICLLLPREYPELIGLGAVMGFLGAAMLVMVCSSRLRRSI